MQQVIKPPSTGDLQDMTIEFWLIEIITEARKRMLLKVDTQKIIFRKDVQPLNEMVLALVGIPSGGDLASTAVQTNGPVEPAPLLVPVQPVPAPIIIRAAYDPIPNGTVIEMGFHEPNVGSALPAPLDWRGRRAQRRRPHNRPRS